MKHYYYYQFEDGYFCYTAGRLNQIELSHEIKKHGKLVKMEVQL